MNLLFIDACNLAYRVGWVHKHLRWNDKPVSLLYGFFTALVGLKKQYPDYHFVVVWDGGYTRRKIESSKGVEAGIIPVGYKENRKDREMPIEMEWMLEQIPELKQALKLVNVQQVKVEGYEADDVIYSYVVKSGLDDKIVVITSDKDYYQMLINDNVVIYDALNKKSTTKASFTEEYGFGSELFVDYCSLTGDSSDGIYGATGWGKVNAGKYVKQYGTIENIYKTIEEKVSRSKREESLLTERKRVELAMSLKKMDIVEVPDIEGKKDYNEGDLIKFFSDNGFSSLYGSTECLTN